MKESDSIFVRQWEQTRKTGRIRYALIRGLAFGLVFFLFTGLYGLYDNSFAQVFLRTRSIIVFLFWVAFGIIGFATLMWPVNEYFYRIKRNP